MDSMPSGPQAAHRYSMSHGERLPLRDPTQTRHDSDTSLFPFPFRRSPPEPLFTFTLPFASFVPFIGGGAQRAEAMDGGDKSDNDLASRLPNRLPVWKQMTLAVLFRGAEKPCARKPAARAMEQEELLTQALAEVEENGVPDDDAIEIDSEDEFQL
ncbi:hypothetical protein B0H10DRAFT_2428853 [Mycena sp. CBHHK59/15]|nr:hypothetical protein B0H10DRAFT_2428853 [Mycena sp. CBHHK59/15]